MIWPTVMVTGHRPQHLRPDARPWVRAELERLTLKLRDEHGTTTGISGMALGADLWFADAVVRAGMQLHAHVPFPQQPDPWRPEDQAEWHRLLSHAAHTITYGTDFDVRLLHARNLGMIRASDAVVAVLRRDKSDGGTASAVRKARAMRLPIIHVDPDARLTVLVRDERTAA